MDKSAVIDRVKSFAEIVRKNFPVQKIVLFGSQIKGTATADSDIDVAIIFNELEDDYLNASTKLFHLRRNIDARIEPLLFEAGHDPSGFLAEILRTGEVIWEAGEGKTN